MLRAPLLQCLVDLLLGERGIGSKHPFLTEVLLALHLRQVHHVENEGRLSLRSLSRTNKTTVEAGIWAKLRRILIDGSCRVGVPFYLRWAATKEIFN